MTFQTQRRPEISIAILTLGVVAYGIGCQPATHTYHNNRNYDVFWTAITYLWVVPICLSALFDSFVYKHRIWHLLLFAVVTAAIDSATLISFYGSNRGRNTFENFYWDKFSWCVPLHVMITCYVEAFIQLLYMGCRTFSDDCKQKSWLPQTSLAGWMVMYSIICISIGFPFAYRSYQNANSIQNGRAQADTCWNKGNPVILLFEFETEISLANNKQLIRYREFDVPIYLPLIFRSAKNHFIQGFNQRMHELMEQHQAARWNVPGDLPNRQETLELLSSKELVPISEIPPHLQSKVAQVKPSIYLFNEEPYHRVMLSDESGPLFHQKLGKTDILRLGNHAIRMYNANGSLFFSAEIK